MVCRTTSLNEGAKAGPRRGHGEGWGHLKLPGVVSGPCPSHDPLGQHHRPRAEHTFMSESPPGVAAGSTAEGWGLGVAPFAMEGLLGAGDRL